MNVREMILEHPEVNGALLRETKEMVDGYIECIFFTNSGDDEDELNDVTIADFSPEFQAEIVGDCAQFIQQGGELLKEAAERVGYDWTNVGHDFWYTRNGHGVGFWDRAELTEEQQTELTKLSESFGSAAVYVGDDGRVYAA